MKNLSFLNVLLLALAIFGLSSCGSDDEVITLSPTVSFGDDVGYLSSDSDLAPGADFSVLLSAAKGDNPLSSLTIQQDGADVAFDRITIVGISTVNNPQLVTGDDTEGFTWDITIRAHDEESDSPYDFIVADNAGNSGSATIYINTIGAAVGPTVSVDGPAAFTATPNSAQIIKINASIGSSPLRTIAVYEDGVLIADLTRMDYEGSNFAGNPETLLGDDVDGLVSEEITLRLGSAGAVYRFEVEDEGGLTGEVDVTINVGTSVEELTGQLLNSSGPVGTGGLDLDTNNGGTGSMDSAAEIKDEGGAPDWQQKISAANNATIRSAANLPEGSKYANITTQEEIEGAFANSDDLAGGVSAVVAIGDEFVVERDGVYYFLLVTDIFVDSAANGDYYEFSIKK